MFYSILHSVSKEFTASTVPLDWTNKVICGRYLSATLRHLCKQEIFSIYGAPGLDRQSCLDKPSFCYYTTTEYLRIFSIYGAPGSDRIHSSMHFLVLGIG